MSVGRGIDAGRRARECVRVAPGGPGRRVNLLCAEIPAQELLSQSAMPKSKSPKTPRIRSLYSALDQMRHPTATNYADPIAGAPRRDPFREDVVHLVHSPYFRRLDGKTQLFPANESDLFRNRLTHSLEVSQVARDIAAHLNATVFSGSPGRPGYMGQINLSLVEFAALAHDIGHPPFGHTGEKALDAEMKEFGGFEGNAQTLRIVTRLARRQYPGDVGSDKDVARGLVSEDGLDLRVGLNLTYRSIAAILKYDTNIPDIRRPDDKFVKGRYWQEREIVDRVKSSVLGDHSIGGSFRVVECWIMDVADDIAYSTYDIEDALCAGVLTAADFLHPRDEVVMAVVRDLRQKLGHIAPAKVRNGLRQFAEIVRYFVMTKAKGSGDSIPVPEDKMTSPRSAAAEEQIFQASERVMLDAHVRTQMTSWWIDYLISNVECIVDEAHPALSIVRLKVAVRDHIEILKSFVFQSVTLSTPLQSITFKGERIVRELFKAFIEYGERLLPPYERRLMERLSPDGQIGSDVGQHRLRRRLLCDYVSGMTDSFASHLYGQLMDGSLSKVVNHQLYY